MPKNNLKLLY